MDGMRWRPPEESPEPRFHRCPMSSPFMPAYSEYSEPKRVHRRAMSPSDDKVPELTHQHKMSRSMRETKGYVRDEWAEVREASNPFLRQLPIESDDVNTPARRWRERPSSPPPSSITNPFAVYDDDDNDAPTGCPTRLVESEESDKYLYTVTPPPWQGLISSRERLSILNTDTASWAKPGAKWDQWITRRGAARTGHGDNTRSGLLRAESWEAVMEPVSAQELRDAEVAEAHTGGVTLEASGIACPEEGREDNLGGPQVYHVPVDVMVEELNSDAYAFDDDADDEARGVLAHARSANSSVELWDTDVAGDHPRVRSVLGNDDTSVSALCEQEHALEDATITTTPLLREPEHALLPLCEKEESLLSANTITPVLCEQEHSLVDTITTATPLLEQENSFLRLREQKQTLLDTITTVSPLLEQESRGESSGKECRDPPVASFSASFHQPTSHASSVERVFLGYGQTIGQSDVDRGGKMTVSVRDSSCKQKETPGDDVARTYHASLRKSSVDFDFMLQDDEDSIKRDDETRSAANRSSRTQGKPGPLDDFSSDDESRAMLTSAGGRYTRHRCEDRSAHGGGAGVVTSRPYETQEPFDFSTLFGSRSSANAFAPFPWTTSTPLATREEPGTIGGLPRGTNSSQTESPRADMSSTATPTGRKGYVTSMPSLGKEDDAVFDVRVLLTGAHCPSELPHARGSEAETKHARGDYHSAGAHGARVVEAPATQADVTTAERVTGTDAAILNLSAVPDRPVAQTQSWAGEKSDHSVDFDTAFSCGDGNSGAVSIDRQSVYTDKFALSAATKHSVVAVERRTQATNNRSVDFDTAFCSSNDDGVATSTARKGLHTENPSLRVATEQPLVRTKARARETRNPSVDFDTAFSSSDDDGKAAGIACQNLTIEDPDLIATTKHPVVPTKARAQGKNKNGVDFDTAFRRSDDDGKAVNVAHQGITTENPDLITKARVREKSYPSVDFDTAFRRSDDDGEAVNVAHQGITTENPDLITKARVREKCNPSVDFDTAFRRSDDDGKAVNVAHQDITTENPDLITKTRAREKNNPSVDVDTAFRSSDDDGKAVDVACQGITTENPDLITKARAREKRNPSVDIDTAFRISDDDDGKAVDVAYQDITTENPDLIATAKHPVVPTKARAWGKRNPSVDFDTAFSSSDDDDGKAAGIARRDIPAEDPDLIATTEHPVVRTKARAREKSNPSVDIDTAFSSSDDDDSKAVDVAYQGITTKNPDLIATAKHPVVPTKARAWEKRNPSVDFDTAFSSSVDDDSKAAGIARQDIPAEDPSLIATMKHSVGPVGAFARENSNARVDSATAFRHSSINNASIDDDDGNARKTIHAVDACYITDTTGGATAHRSENLHSDNACKNDADVYSITKDAAAISHRKEVDSSRTNQDTSFVVAHKALLHGTISRNGNNNDNLRQNTLEAPLEDVSYLMDEDRSAIPIIVSEARKAEPVVESVVEQVVDVDVIQPQITHEKSGDDLFTHFPDFASQDAHGDCDFAASECSRRTRAPGSLRPCPIITEDTRYSPDVSNDDNGKTLSDHTEKFFGTKKSMSGNTLLPRHANSGCLADDLFSPTIASASPDSRASLRVNIDGDIITAPRVDLSPLRRELSSSSSGSRSNIYMPGELDDPDDDFDYIGRWKHDSNTAKKMKIRNPMSPKSTLSFTRQTERFEAQARQKRAVLDRISRENVDGTGAFLQRTSDALCNTLKTLSELPQPEFTASDMGPEEYHRLLSTNARNLLEKTQGLKDMIDSVMLAMHSQQKEINKMYDQLEAAESDLLAGRDAVHGKTSPQRVALVQESVWGSVVYKGVRGVMVDANRIQIQDHSGQIFDSVLLFIAAVET